jgi:3-hydroxyisobutyrate dehydrogenase-like beta-hydroxyacid dehydrogenase
VPAERSRPTAYQSFGVVGLGAMGGPVAGHLLAAGHPVVVHDLDAAAVQSLVDRGAVVARSPAELAAAVDVVSIFVPTDDDVLDVCTGPTGVLAGSRSPSLVLLCSSVRPDTCRTVAGLAGEGVAVVDAALTGGVRAAEGGTINLLTGGDERALEPALDLLGVWTAAVHHLGPLGAGQVGKSVNNLIHWAQISAITEALELGRRQGVDVPTLRRALMDGPTDSRTLRELEQMRLTWHAKDLANAALLGEQVSMSLPVAEVVRTVMTQRSVASVAALLESAGDPSAPIKAELANDVAEG